MSELSMMTGRGDEARPAPVAFTQAMSLWAKVGFLSFGGAAGQIAMLHRFVVEERRWIDEHRFLNALNYCTLLPGPEAQQLATYIGWLLHGVRGGLAAGLLFVLPGALVMLGLSLLYVMGSGVPLIDGVFFGIKAAVLAIVVEAVLRIGRRALRTRLLVSLAVASFIALFFLRLPFPLVVLAAGFMGFLAARRHPALVGVRDGDGARPPPAPGRVAGAVRSGAAWLAVWWAPVLLAAVTLGPGHVLVDLGLFFSKLAVVTFGGAYAVLAYLADAAVNAKHWATAAEMVDGLGLAETTPGPTILVNQFVGFLAAFRAPEPFTPLVAGTLGAAMTVWVTFVPSFLWIFAGAPFMEDVTHDRRLAGALAAITAAVVGVIANLALWFALNVLFAVVGEWWVGPVRVVTVELASLRLDALVMSLVAFALLFAWHRGVITTVGLLAAAGMGRVMLVNLIG
ncbi:chromate efflux transporter [Chelatococcus sp. SYSU_G07232]|uniref:Chromate efflux transporter n=1 Tax=Chelatococcus albus TaxID=3047466 RepID=A0ABT7AG69_9HYPH|nr:chromate efflux transporter [Chelatococcus sp. SYSU_G07232]MDJ1158372.1 chromate efflux transporter [Chelatococcus sp. SYSU_G07232]